MKNSSIKQFNLILFFLFIQSVAHSQYFQTPSNGSTAANLSVNPNITNNDVLRILIGSYLDDFRVAVYNDGPIPNYGGLAWEVNSQNFGLLSGNTIFSLYYGGPISFVDVCLVTDPGNGNTVHAVACYYISGAGWYVEDFGWNGSSFTALGVTAIAYGTAGTTMNIDGDSYGNIIVTYDDNSNNIYCVTGTFNTGLSLNSAAFAIPTLGAFPDVCLYNDGTTKKAYFAYVDVNVSPANLNVDWDTWTNLLIDGTNVTPIVANSPPHYNGLTFLCNFSFPRIACPNSSGNSAYWSVVVQEDDRTTYYIDGYNSQVGSGATCIPYNDATVDPYYDITSVSNILPVVTYDSYSNVWVGWNMDNSLGTLTGAMADAIYPVVLPCDYGGVPLTSSLYLEVPAGVSTQDNMSYLSLSSKNSLDLLVTYFDFTANPDLYNKWLPSFFASGGLRTTYVQDQIASVNLIKALSDYYGSEKLTLRLYDLNGKLVFEEKETAQNMKNTVSNQFKNHNYPLSIYHLKIFSDDGKFYLTKKIFVTN